MINLKYYPLVQFISTRNNEGILKKTNLLSNSFLTNKDNTLFTAQKSSTLASFGKHIKAKQNGNLREILFHGFNFSSKRIKLGRLKYFVDTHKSEVFICDEPVAGTFKSRVHKRRLIFFSYDDHLVNTIAKLTKEFRLPDSYTGKGLFERNDSYNIKERKKRK
jgi:hypothetical protein